VKVLLYYNPDDDPRTNTIKQALIERVGAECAALDVPFFLETLAYDDNLDANSLEFARRKPGMVKRSMEEFTRPEYGVDVLKVEVPFHPAFVEGMSTFGGTAAYNRAEALELYRQAASATDKPFIYLSAGVSDDVFREELEMAGEAGVRYNGVLCGRATWKEGIPVYAQQGYQALLDWLEDRGVQNITALNDVLNRSAHSWWEVYGGKENIEVIG
jgi:tagatose 1,6-diphosphate aldolase